MHRLDTSNATELKKFDSYLYYSTLKAPELKTEKPPEKVLLRPAGTRLLADYYKEKYATDITLHGDSLDDIPAWLNDCSKQSGNPLRKVLILIIGDENPHAVPVIYLREEGNEMLLYANSLGMDPEKAKKIALTYKIPFGFIEHARQLDRVSCYLDAVIFGRDITKRNKKTGNYILPDFLKKLRKTQLSENCFSIKLPDELLQTAQKDDFFNEHAEHAGRKIHKDKTIEQRRQRFFDHAVFSSGKTENLSSYVREKGLCVRFTIEIEFYCQELQNQFGESWHSLRRETFVTEAKAFLKCHSAPSNAINYLHQFTVSWLMKNRNENAMLNVPMKEKQESPADDFDDSHSTYRLPQRW